ncbi:TetR/AcrR family transcriptional regulator [Pseudaestuariivita sp.]|uniref:TetR/AcrR family transcriptional regulator n=1 Tax=Pseudaestuariivita sp. TaxID=2211669 RepID=UPI00405A1E15
MGLREQQKTDRQARILAAASDLYADRGFDPVRAEEIAEAAQVSTATLYNYFGGKGDILMTLVLREAEMIRDRTAPLIADPPRGALTAYHAYFAAWFEPKTVLRNRDLWRRGIALSFTEDGTAASARLRDVDAQLLAQVMQLTKTLRARGELKMTLDCEAFGEGLFNAVNMLFFEHARAERQSLDALRTQVAKTVETLARLALR